MQISKSMWKNAPDLCGSIKMDELQDLFRSAGKKQDQTTETKSSKKYLFVKDFCSIMGNLFSVKQFLGA